MQMQELAYYAIDDLLKIYWKLLRHANAYVYVRRIKLNKMYDSRE